MPNRNSAATRCLRRTVYAARSDGALFPRRLPVRDLSIGMSQTSFSKKMSGARGFEVEELGQIADYFSSVTGRPLAGWPFVGSIACREIEDAMEEARKKRRPPPGPHRPST